MRVKVDEAEVERIVQDIKAFGIRWFGITLREHQLDIARFIIRAKLAGYKRVFILFPRRHGKTTLLQIMLAYFIANDPKIKINVSANTEQLASMITRPIKNKIQNDITMQKEYGLIPGRPWNLKESYLLEELHPVLIAKATGSRVSGISTDHILLDDIIDRENIKTEKMLKDIEEWVTGSLYYTLDPMKEFVIIIGTRKAMRDWYDQLLMNPNIPHLIQPCIVTAEDGTESPLWPKEEDTQRGFTMMDLEEKRAENPVAFAREWMLVPSPPEGYIFRREDIQYFSQLPHRDYLKYWIGIDPAYGESKRSSMTAFVVIAYEKRTNWVYVVEMFKDRMPLRKQIAKAEELFLKYEPEKVIIESVMAFGEMFKEYQKAIPRTKALTYSEKLSKELRIESTLSPLYRDGQLWYRDPKNDHFTHTFIENELLEFGASHGIRTIQSKTPMDLLDAHCISMSEINFNRDRGPAIRTATARTY